MNILCSWIGQFKILKMSVICKVIKKYNETPSKILSVFKLDLEDLIQGSWENKHANSDQNPNNIFCKNRKIHPKIHMESQGTQIANRS